MTVGVHIADEFRFRNPYGRPPTDLPFHSLDPYNGDWDSVIRRFVYSGVYRLDEANAPVPDLATELCDVSSDLLVLTCELREARFHDGTALTADDVAFTYQMLLSDGCRMPYNCVTAEGFALEAVTAIDDRTVEFRLSEPEPSLVSTLLPNVLIEPRQRVEAAYAEFVDASNGADPAALRDAASRLGEAMVSPDGTTPCTPPGETLLAEVERAIGDIGHALRSRDAYVGPGATVDECAYGEYLERVLNDLADSLSATGIDAIAASYRVLDLPAVPVGSGPWRVTSIDPGVGMDLAAFADFHRGVPATSRLQVRLLRTTAEAVEAVRTGAVDWLEDPFAIRENFIAEGLAGATGLTWVEYEDLGYQGVHYNLREGRLFADGNLRAAMELCVDKEEAVAAATGGRAVPINSPISPSMWAFEPDLTRPPARDVDAARQLIEASGWAAGEDGVYRKGEERLATEVPVVEGQHEWITFLELLAFQVADCGIELRPEPITGPEFFAAVGWPLTVPGAAQPWDAMFIFVGWGGDDPDVSGLFHSSAAISASNPGGTNFSGYQSTESDALLEQGRATYDQRERARIYREFQRVVASDRPVLFGWSGLVRSPRSERMQSTAGPLATDSPSWWWQLETLYLDTSAPEG